MKILIHHQLDHEPRPPQELGDAARRLLAWAWDRPTRDGSLIAAALLAVRSTLASDPIASETLLRRCIEPTHLAKFGFDELPWLVLEPAPLIEHTPAFFADCFTAVFGFDEDSTESTALYDSSLMPMMSTRAQDYRMARSSLGDAFPKLLEREPKLAMKALTAMARSHADGHRDLSKRRPPVRIRWRGKTYRIEMDASHRWDGVFRSKGDAASALAVFESDMSERIRSEPATIAPMLDALSAAPLPASVLARLLLAAAETGQAAPDAVAELLTKPTLLDTPELEYAAGSFLRSVFVHLPAETRRRIEHALVRLPRRSDEDERSRNEALRLRDAYIGTLALDAIVTPAVRDLHAEVLATGAHALREPLSVEVRRARYVPSYDEDLLRRGIDPSNPVDRQLWSAIERLTSAMADSREPLNRDERRELAALLRRAQREVARANHAGASQLALSEAQTSVTEIAEVLSRYPGALTQPQGRLVKDILLDGAQQLHSTAVEQSDDEVTSSSPSPRSHAAEGLPQLAREPNFASAAVLSAIVTLAADPSPEIRQLVVVRLGALGASAPTDAWAIAEHIAQNEHSPTVLQSLIHALDSLAHRDSARALGLVNRVLTRECARDAPRQLVIDDAVALLISHHIWRGSDSGAAVSTFVAQADVVAESTGHLLHEIRDTLFHGATEPADPHADAIRQRSLEFIRQLVSTARLRVQEHLAAHAGNLGDPKWTEAERTSLRGWLRIAGAVGDQLFFASGVFQADHPGDERHADMQQRARLYHEARDVLAELVEFGEARTLHHLMEMLEGCVEFDPAGVFILIANAVRSSAAWGYQYESLAEQLIVRIVKAYLVEHPDILRNDELERALMDILDVFVEAGWPSARRLVYGLADVFR